MIEVRSNPRVAVNDQPMRLLQRDYDALARKRVFVVEAANGRVLTFRVDDTDARFYDAVSERTIVALLRVWYPEEWSLPSNIVEWNLTHGHARAVP